METLRRNTTSALVALLTAAAVFLAGNWAAGALRGSELYSKSRLISMIVSQGEIGFSDMAGNKRNMDMMLKFVGAVTSAYINFEMIPVGEVGTFLAVFESTPGGVAIERFEYHRKNLAITGSANSLEEYQSFRAALQDTGYFESVTGYHYLATDNTIRFELECASQSAPVHIEFNPLELTGGLGMGIV